MQRVNNISCGNNYYNQKQNKKVNFGSADINMLATSDNHGKVESLPYFWNAIEHNIDRIFPKKETNSTLEVGIIGGDWFMKPDSKGFITDSKMEAGQVQLNFLNKLVSSIKDRVPGIKVLYTPGNHDLDGGDRRLMKYLGQADITTVFTNAYHKSSPAITDLSPEEREKIKEYAVLEVPDDKNPKKIHKALFLGVMIMGIDYYNPELVNDIDFIDRTNKKDADIKEEDIEYTFKALNKVIGEFKKENPQGAVVLTSHTGNRISEMLVKNVKGINMVWNGHDHEDRIILVKDIDNKDVPVISLGHDFKKFDSASLHFEDDGSIKLDNFKVYNSRFNNPFTTLLAQKLGKDMKPLLYIEGPENMEILSQKGVRKENSLLANFVNDAILSSINKYEPGTQIFGMPSSAIRQDLPVNKGITNLEIRNIMSGQTDSLSNVHVGNVKGSAIAQIIMENLEEHRKNEDRNTMIQWSGIQIQKTKLIEMLLNNPIEKINLNNVKNYIKIKNKEGKYEPVKFEQTYKMAIPEYFFKKPKIIAVKELENEFKPINKTMNELFREHLTDNNYRVKAPDPEDIRIIK